jgi:hypothetical protein
MAYVPPAMAKRSHAIIDSSARAAGRDPSSIRRLYNIWGSFTAGPGGPIDETEGQFAGSPEQWIQLITHLATSVGFDNFVIGGPPDPAVLRLIGQEIAPAVRDRVARSRAQG